LLAIEVEFAKSEFVVGYPEENTRVLLSAM
jgi:hypothetical protein